VGKTKDKASDSEDVESDALFIEIKVRTRLWNSNSRSINAYFVD